MKKEDVIEMEEWKERVNQDISELKRGQSELFGDKRRIEKDIQDLKISDMLQDKEITSLKEALNAIKDDTTWIRRRITGALITAVITAVVGGIIAVAISQIYGG